MLTLLKSRVARGARQSIVGALLLLPLGLSTVDAQQFPAKPIALVVAFGAGGASDLILRTFIDTAPAILGQPVVIQIRSGGGGAIASELVAHAKPLLAPPQSLPHVRAGKLRALAWSGAARHPDLPLVPTAAEQGFDRTLTVFKGVMAPKGTPRPVVERIAAAFKRMLETRQAIDGIRRLGDEVAYLGPDEFEGHWRAEFQTFKELGRIFRRR